jgi:hypothetical protein
MNQGHTSLALVLPRVRTSLRSSDSSLKLSSDPRASDLCDMGESNLNHSHHVHSLARNCCDIWLGGKHMAPIAAMYTVLSSHMLRMPHLPSVIQLPIRAPGCFIGEAKTTLWIAIAAVAVLETGACLTLCLEPSSDHNLVATVVVALTVVRIFQTRMQPRVVPRE